MHKGPLYLLAGALCFATTGTAQTFAPEGATPYVIGAVRLWLGFAALFCYCLAARRPFWTASWKRADLRWIVPAGLSLAGYQIFFFRGVIDAGVAVGTVASVGFSPVVVAVLARLFLGERPERRWYASTALAVGGLLLLNCHSVNAGDVFVLAKPLAAGCCYAGYYVFAKPLAEDRAPEAVMTMLFGVGAIALLPVFFLLPVDWLATPRGAAVALHYGVVATALAYTLTLAGLRTTPASTAATVGLAEPLGASMLGVFLLGETVSALSLCAMGLMMAGVLLSALAPSGNGTRTAKRR